MALATVRSCAIDGVRALPVFVEVHIGGGLPSMSIVGLPQSSVRESKDRVRAALSHLGFRFPQVRVTVNLAPADVPKQGGRFDLPIALGVLVASGQLPPRATEDLVVIGELGLTGELRAVRGALPAALALGDAAGLLLPGVNAAEAALAGVERVYAADSLEEACRMLRDPARPSRREGSDSMEYAKGATGGGRAEGPDMADVEGQPQARRAVEIAAAGGHDLLLYGPPGTGKSMLAARLCGLRPEMTRQEALEAASVASVARRGFDPATWRVRPYRCPHHTASAVALVGGGSGLPMPGEISLAHRGVLFLDEIAEFPRGVLDALREPMESGRVTLSRAARQADFPAAFQLVAAMNPCPCGRFGAEEGERCRCSAGERDRYLGRLSGPFLDRIDLCLQMRSPRRDDGGTSAPESSAALRARVQVAADRQRTRQGVENRELEPRRLLRFARLESPGRALLDEATARLGLSLRARHRVLRVARTIADLAGADGVAEGHLAEALAYRQPPGRG